MDLTLIPAYAHREEIHSLFSEYMTMLLEGDPSFQDYLNVQHYEEELEDLEKKYGLPGGRLYLACEGEAVVGCVALRRLDEQRGELKRLYVKPAFRGKKYGERLLLRIIADAREIGYSQLLLDTLPFLQTAIRMYRRHGFYEIDRYNDSPMDSCIYMQLDL